MYFLKMQSTSFPVALWLLRRAAVVHDLVGLIPALFSRKCFLSSFKDPLFLQECLIAIWTGFLSLAIHRQQGFIQALLLTPVLEKKIQFL